MMRGRLRGAPQDWADGEELSVETCTVLPVQTDTQVAQVRCLCAHSEQLPTTAFARSHRLQRELAGGLNQL